MPETLALGATVVALLGIFRLLLGRSGRLPQIFRRGSFRTLGGDNAGALFAVVGLAQLVLDWSDKLSQLGANSAHLAVLMAALLIAGSIGACFRSIRAVLTIVGIAAGVADVWISHGAVAALALLVVVALMVWTYGLVRTFRP